MKREGARAGKKRDMRMRRWWIRGWQYDEMEKEKEKE